MNDFMPSKIKLLKCEREKLKISSDELSVKCNRLSGSIKRTVDLMYAEYEAFDIYDIFYVDYWYASLALDYKEKNYDLYDELFEVSKEIDDIPVFNLQLPTLIDIYNVLAKICVDTFGIDVAVPINVSKETNSVIAEFKRLVDTCRLVTLNEEWEYNFLVSLQKLYTFLDFGLYSDKKHDDLRTAVKHYNEEYEDLQLEQRPLLLRIEELDDEISKLENDFLEMEQKRECFKTSAQSQMDDYIEAASETRGSVAEKASDIIPNKNYTFSSICASIGLSLLSFVIFWSSYLLSVIIVILLTALLSQIPILNWLVKWFYSTKEQPLSWTVVLIALTFACVVVNTVMTKIIHNDSVAKLTGKLYGISLALCGAVFLITNIIAKGPLFADICILITGIVYFSKSFNSNVFD